jgi:uncharacterized Zn finger protein
MKSRVEVKLDKLLEAYLWMCSSLEETNQAVIHRHTGHIVWRGVDAVWIPPEERSDLEILSVDEDEDECASVWVYVPEKHELDLGNDIVFAFTRQHIRSIMTKSERSFASAARTEISVHCSGSLGRHERGKNSRKQKRFVLCGSGPRTRGSASRNVLDNFRITASHTNRLSLIFDRP